MSPPALPPALVAANDAGADAYERGAPAAAVTAYARATALLTPGTDPQALLVYENLARALYDLGRFPAAVRALLRAIDGRRPGPEPCLRLLIPALVASGRAEQARGHLADYLAAYGPHPHGIEPGALAALAAAHRRRRAVALPG